MTARKTLLVMAGGTGGHIFPALAVADYLKALGWRVVWMGNPEGMEASLLPFHHYIESDIIWLRFSALRGKGLMRKLLLPVNLLRGFAQAACALRKIRPQAVLGMGGYISFPGGMMAALMGYPLIIHEQNAIAGLANRVLAIIADRVVTGFPNVFSKGQCLGNPVRAAMTTLPAPSVRYAERMQHAEPLRVLVVGGSLGAQILNEVVPKALALIPSDERRRCFSIVHQAGAKHISALRDAYAQAGMQAGVDVELAGFINDMSAYYAQADIVICRAGALTVAELAAVGVASILVPFPHAVDDHQTHNARFLEEAGAAWIVPQRELTPERLANLFRQFKRKELQIMAEKAWAHSKPAATQHVAQVCMALADSL